MTSIDLGWYVPTKQAYHGRQRPRWVLVCANDHVLYGNGGSLHKECKVSTFQRWKRRVQAKRESQQ